MILLKELIIFSDNILRRIPGDHHCFVTPVSTFLYQLLPSSHSIGQEGHLRLRPCLVWSLSDVCYHGAVPEVAEARTPSVSQVAVDHADTRRRDDGLSHPETSATITLPHASYNFRSLQQLLGPRAK